MEMLERDQPELMLITAHVLIVMSHFKWPFCYAMNRADGDGDIFCYEIAHIVIGWSFCTSVRYFLLTVGFCCLR